MSKTLGLDLGPNSIGWAVINEENETILGAGVRIFQEGVNQINTAKEQSKNATRREARQLRRQHFRKRLRKKHLKKILRKNQMLPDNSELKDWFKLNPYELRSRAVNEKISLQELGRIFYHFAQRRGFKSTRKAEEEGKIYEGKKETGTKGITLGGYLHEISYKEGEPFKEKERVRNRYTLREMYEAEFDAIWDKQKKYHPQLTDELRYKIGYKPETNGNSRKDGVLFFQRPLRSQKSVIGKCLFESKPYYNHEDKKWITIGKPRCPISHPGFELFRTHQFINTIEYGKKQRLNEQQRKQVLELFNKKATDFKFKEIKKRLKLTDEKFNYDDEQKLSANQAISTLSKLFGEKTWWENYHYIWHCFFDYDDNNKLIEKLKSTYGLKEKDEKKARKFRLKDGYSNLSLKAINNILPFLEKGYMYHEAVILGGIRNAFGVNRWEQLPDVDREHIEEVTIQILKEKNLVGEAIEKIKQFLSYEYELGLKELSRLYHHSQQGFTSITKKKLDMPPEVRNPVVKQALFELRKVVNAIIGEYLEEGEEFEHIRVELARDLRQTSKQRRDQLKTNRDREEINQEAREVLAEYGLAPSRENIHKYLLWYELVKRAGKAICPYTGKTISIEDLFGRENRFQIEHIIPYSRSLDDSLANKTLCDAFENQQKGERSPYEYYFKYKQDEKLWTSISERAFEVLPYDKAKRFVSRDLSGLDDFISRQLNDTRYISRLARQYLQTVSRSVSNVPGQLTAELRRMWGMNSILNPPLIITNCWQEEGKYWAIIKNGEVVSLTKIKANKPTAAQDEEIVEGRIVRNENGSAKFIPEKSRNDHRHHVVDALAVALTKPYYLNKLSYWNSRYRMGERPEFPLPWNSFLQDANASVKNILVSYHASNPVTTRIRKMLRYKGKKLMSEGLSARGQLHKDSIFGKRQAPNLPVAYHIRKPIESINKKAQLDKIVDPVIRDLMLKRLRELGIDTGGNYKVPAGAFFQENPETGKVESIIKLPNKRGEKVPVRKVRIMEKLSNAVMLKESAGANQWVNPRNNHHIAIYRNHDGELYEEVVTLWDAVKRKQLKLPVINTDPQDGSEFVLSMQRNELFLLGHDGSKEDISNVSNDEVSDKLYRVQKLSSGYYTFRHNLFSLTNEKDGLINIQSFSAFNNLNPIKVKIDILGKLSPIT